MYSIHRAFAHFDNNKTFSSLFYINIVKSRFGREAKNWLLLRPVLRFFRVCSFPLTRGLENQTSDHLNKTKRKKERGCAAKKSRTKFSVTHIQKTRTNV